MTTTDRRLALSLVELTSVVSAVALLAAVLAPALADAGRRGKSTVCLQNLGRIAQASIVYAGQDPDEQAIPVHPTMSATYLGAEYQRMVSAVAYGGKSGRGLDRGSYYFWGTAEHRGPATRPLNRVLYGNVFPDYAENTGSDEVNWTRDTQLDLSVYRCPSDSGYTGIHYTSWRYSGMSSYDHYGSSYAANVFWTFSYNEGVCKSNGTLLHRLSDIVNPAETLYYLENCGRFAFLADPQGLPGHECGQAPQATVGGWHGRAWTFNVSFVDGHADAIRIKGYENPDLGHYPGEDYEHWDCTIVRGSGWQMDTLPLPPVPSTIPCGTGRCGDSDCPDDAASLVTPDVE